ncbi:MAG: PDC sensor domain-containing protein [Candidatus Bathyarchaeota archaeon]|nr:PDC sensor domain-containing protein [Candidatus Bathyarchaeota archaeon]
MEKLKAVTLALVALLIISISANIYQLNTNHPGAQNSPSAVAGQEMLSQLMQTQNNIDINLAKLDAAMQVACQQLSATGLSGSQARAVLDQLVANDTLIVNAATCDADDVLLAVEPQSYSSIEGEDISGQEQNLAMHQTMRPAMSNMISLVEGFPGVVLSAPIFDADHKFMGSLSIVIQPYLLIRGAIESLDEAPMYSMWSMQINGTLIYDPDPTQQSKNLFTDPLYIEYPEVQSFAHQVAQQRWGQGSYQYYDKDVSDESKHLVEKEAYWTTVGAYGTEWRLVVWRPLNQ